MLILETFLFQDRLSFLFKLGCTEANTDYTENDIYDTADKNANTERLCQEACQRHPQCNWWMLDVYTWNKYGCWLKTEKDLSKKKTNKGRTFGPRFCRKHSSI